MKKYIFNTNALNWLIVSPCLIMSNVFIDVSLLIAFCFIGVAIAFAPRKSKTNQNDLFYFILTFIIACFVLVISLINLKLYISLGYLAVIALIIYNNQDLKYIQKAIKFSKQKIQKNKASD